MRTVICLMSGDTQMHQEQSSKNNEEAHHLAIDYNHFYNDIHVTYRALVVSSQSNDLYSDSASKLPEL
eukprot:2867949-Amphidinium_carterae.1